MIQQFVLDNATFEQVKEYIINDLERYCILRIRENKDTEGLHHAITAVENAFKHMKDEYGIKKKKTAIDHTV